MKYRQADFDARFDRETVFYDCIQLLDNRIVLLGPPLLNLADLVDDVNVADADTGQTIAFKKRDLDRQVQFWGNARHEVRALRITSSVGNALLAVHRSREAVFDGRRVLFTKNKDNDLRWIADWVRFHRDHHGADAVLLYDNESSRYGVSDIKAALGGIQGIAHIEIVPWPYKYGVDSFEGRFWDSDFSMHGILEDARWRYLQRAKSVLGVDIDELVMPSSRTVFEVAESSGSGYVRFFGRWVVGTDASDERLPDVGSSSVVRHRDFQYRLRSRPRLRSHPRFRLPLLRFDDRSAPKWAVVPSKCPAEAQWRIHTIDRWKATTLPFRAMSFGHFREVNTGWKYRRSVRDSFDRRKHERWLELARAFDGTDWDR